MSGECGGRGGEGEDFEREATKRRNSPGRERKGMELDIAVTIYFF